MIANVGSSRFLAIPDADLRLACVTIYNDAVAELQRTTNGRLLPQAIEAGQHGWHGSWAFSMAGLLPRS